MGVPRAKFVAGSKASKLREFYQDKQEQLFSLSLKEAAQFAVKEGKIKGVQPADISAIRQGFQRTGTGGEREEFSKEEVVAVKRFLEKNGGLAKIKGILDFIELIAK